MQNQPAPRSHGVPESFSVKFGQHITAVLSGFDRIGFRATLRVLYRPSMMDRYLGYGGVKLKDFKTFAESTTAKVKAAADRAAALARRPLEYLRNPGIAKDELARQVVERDNIKEGLMAIFSAVEPCWSYSVRGEPQSKPIKLVLETRQCTHFYHYYLHPQFGLAQVRVQSWFPLSVDVCLNGREWLARPMDGAGIGYEKRDHCFVAISDPTAAQELCLQQLRTDWAARLDELLNLAHPLHAQLGKPIGQRYYWTATQTEFATDLCFKDKATLEALYPQFLHHGIRSFSSPDVLRFLGRVAPEHFCHGEVKSSLKHRPEGIRLRHRVNGNSLKLYNKQGSVLRVETTIVKPGDFKVYRPDAQGRLKWQRLRLGVADLWRRGQVSQAANSRYLEALACVTGSTPLYQEAQRVCCPVFVAGKRYRALNPWSPQDGELLEAINRGEFTLNGLRNPDLRHLLYPSTTTSIEQRRRQSAALTRKLALRRAHGLIRKIPGTHRYVLTFNGRRIVTALLAARRADIDQLTQLAA
jgi:hypothetical protein